MILSSKLLSTKYRSIINPIKQVYIDHKEAKTQSEIKAIDSPLLTDEEIFKQSSLLFDTIDTLKKDPLYKELLTCIDEYYGTFLARKTINGYKPVYNNTPQQYQLESLLWQMKNTDHYNLMSIKSSMEALL